MVKRTPETCVQYIQNPKETRPTISVICCMIAVAYCFHDALLGRLILINISTILVCTGTSWWLIRRYNRSHAKWLLAMAAFENYKSRLTHTMPPNSCTILGHDP